MANSERGQARPGRELVAVQVLRDGDAQQAADRGRSRRHHDVPAEDRLRAESQGLLDRAGIEQADLRAVPERQVPDAAHGEAEPGIEVSAVLVP